jgi:hypothetical protein
MSGMLTSETTTSGTASASLSSASAPLEAVVTR